MDEIGFKTNWLIFFGLFLALMICPKMTDSCPKKRQVLC